MWTCQSDRRWLSGKCRLALFSKRTHQARARRYYVDASMPDHLKSFPPFSLKVTSRRMSLPSIRPHATRISRLSQASPTSAKEKGLVLLPSWDSECRHILSTNSAKKNSETVGRDCERQDGVHQWHHWIKITATQACIFSLFRPCRSQWSLYCRSVAGDLKLLTICFGYADQQEPKPMIMNKFHTTSTRWHWKIQLMCYSSTFTFFKTRPLKIRTQGDRAIAPESTKDVKKS